MNANAMNALDELSLRLQRVFTNRPGEAADWREPLAMPAALGRVRQAFADRQAERAGPRTNRSLLAFRMAPQGVGFVDLKLVCRALARPADWQQRRLIDDERLFAQLLAQVDALRPQPRRYQACRRALLAAWQELTEEQKDHASALQDSELRLQSWIETSMPNLKGQP